MLNRCIQAIYKSLVALLPICPQKAAAGLKQLNVDIAGKTIGQLLAAELPAGHKLGDGGCAVSADRADDDGCNTGCGLSTGYGQDE